MKQEITEKIREFLINDLLVEFDEAVTDETDLFEAGLVDSYGFVELIVFIEKNFSITFTDEEFLESPMNTLRDLSQLVAKK